MKLIDLHNRFPGLFKLALKERERLKYEHIQEQYGEAWKKAELDSIFTWDDTKQGHSFWYDIQDHENNIKSWIENPDQTGDIIKLSEDKERLCNNTNTYFWLLLNHPRIYHKLIEIFNNMGLEKPTDDSHYMAHPIFEGTRDYEFWCLVLEKKKFKLFYERYPINLLTDLGKEKEKEDMERVTVETFGELKEKHPRIFEKIESYVGKDKLNPNKKIWMGGFGGFQWSSGKEEGGEFWMRVLGEGIGDLRKFYERYPEPKETPKEDYDFEEIPEKEEKLDLKEKKKEKTMSLEQQIVKVVNDHVTSKESKEILKKQAVAVIESLGISINQVEYIVKTPEFSTKVDKVHFKFPVVLSAITARIPVALVGPAGSGKTTTVEKAAESLKLPFFSKSVSLQTGIHEFFGYQDANGKYVPTLFREAYENGGVFLLDEFDAGNPNVLAALNQATANNSCAFADKMVKKHKDFICVMAGNTYGHGATRDYVGRNQIDAATLDRFAFIDFPYDEELEKQLSGNIEWFNEVKKFRKIAADKKIKTVISPRATFHGAKLLAQGMDKAVVKELVILKGLSETERKLLCQN